MEKIWYLLINHTKEGPFSIHELKSHLNITPDTLVWREGFSEWKKIRDVPELKNVFKDERKASSIHDKPESTSVSAELMDDQAALTIGQDPQLFILWILLLIAVILYIIYR